VGLVPGAADGASQVQGLPVIPLSLREVTADLVQRPALAQRLNFAAPAAEVPEDVQSLLQVPGRAQVLTGQPPYDPQVEEGAGLAEPVAEVAGRSSSGSAPPRPTASPANWPPSPRLGHPHYPAP
jgi:hypothetical protein